MNTTEKASKVSITPQIAVGHGSDRRIRSDVCLAKRLGIQELDLRGI